MGWSLMLPLTVAAAPIEAPAELDWLSGHWLSCRNGRQDAESWSVPRGGFMFGHMLTLTESGARWEQMRIESRDGQVVFHAQPQGQAGGSFPLKHGGPGEAVFENPEHDFPSRIIYRRSGDRLTGRIEGTIAGEPRSAEWHFQKSAPDARCPEPSSESQPEPRSSD